MSTHPPRVRRWGPAPPRCHGCRYALPRRARFCGRCGTATAAAPSAGGRAAAGRGPGRARTGGAPPASGGRRAPAPLRRAAVAAVIAAAAAAATLLAGAPPLPAPGGSSLTVTLPAPTAVTATTGAAGQPAEPGPTPGADDAGTEPGGTPRLASPPTSAVPSCTTRTGVLPCVRWTTQLARGTGPAPDLAVTDRLVLVADADGGVRAHDLGSGAHRWTSQSPPGPRLQPVVAGTVPVVAGDRLRFLDLATGVTVGTADAAPERTASTGPWLLARDQGTVRAYGVNGTTSWERPIAPERRAWLTTHGAYLSGTLAVLSDELVRLTGTTGQPRWSLPIAGLVASVHAAGSTTVVGVDDTGRGAAVVVVDPRGEVLGQHRLPGRVAWVEVDPGQATAAVVTEGGRGASLVVVDTATGAAHPPVQLGQGAAATLPPAIADGVVAVAHGLPEPTLTVVGRADGLVRSRIDPGPGVQAVALPGDATLVAVHEHGVRAWSLGTGLTRWELATEHRPRLVHPRPLLVAADGQLLAMVADPGRRLHERRPVDGDAVGSRRAQGRGSTS